MDVVRALATVGGYMFTDEGWYPYSITYSYTSLATLLFLFVLDISPCAIEGFVWAVKGHRHTDGTRNLALRSQIGIRLFIVSVKLIVMVAVDILVSAMLPALLPILILCLVGYITSLVVVELASVITPIFVSMGRRKGRKNIVPSSEAPPIHRVKHREASDARHEAVPPPPVDEVHCVEDEDFPLSMAPVAIHPDDFGRGEA